jgi:hypothetical protein
VARIRFIPVLATTLVLAGCGAAQRPAMGESSVRPPEVYAAGSTVVGLPGGRVRLAAPPVAPLAGWLTPAAVPSPDQRRLAYNAWRELRRDDPALSWADQGIEPGDPLATPSIRLYDVASGTDEVLEEGAFSVAWRADGALAYFRGAERDYRAAVPYVGDVVVRAAIDEEAEVWSSERARYIVVAWAGNSLVAYREREGEALDVVVFEGPGRMRMLARNSALVAMDPYGERAFVEQGPSQGRPSVRVLNIADGTQVAALDLTGIDPSVGAVSYSGDWRGDRVVAPSASGLAIFRVAGTSIELEQALRVEAARGLAEPRFADAAGRRVTAWTSGGGGGVFLDCDRVLERCERLVPLPEARGARGFPTWRRPLYNPSRPR